MSQTLNYLEIYTRDLQSEEISDEIVSGQNYIRRKNAQKRNDILLPTHDVTLFVDDERLMRSK